MLVPAILYKDQIIQEFHKYYYTTDMLYETGCMCNWCPDIVDCPSESQFQYAIVNDNNKLIGYLGYYVDWYASKADNFGLFSFDRGNVLVSKSVFMKLEELVKTCIESNGELLVVIQRANPMMSLLKNIMVINIF